MRKLFSLVPGVRVSNRRAACPCGMPAFCTMRSCMLTLHDQHCYGAYVLRNRDLFLGNTFWAAYMPDSRPPDCSLKRPGS